MDTMLKQIMDQANAIEGQAASLTLMCNAIGIDSPGAAVTQADLIKGKILLLESNLATLKTWVEAY